MDTTETRWQRHVDDGRRYVSQGDYAQAERSLLASVKEALALAKVEAEVGRLAVAADRDGLDGDVVASVCP